MSHKRSIRSWTSLGVHGWESACQCRGHRSDPWSGKLPCYRAVKPTCHNYWAHAPWSPYVCYSLSPLTFCDPMDCSLPASSVHGILQARILKWVAIASSRGSFQPRDRTQVFCIAGRFFNIWATRGAHTLQQKKPQKWKACSLQLERSPGSLQLEKALAQQRRPSRIKSNNK